MRVAVVGIPRGGTSVVAGLLRIAGFELPNRNAVCALSESKTLRRNGLREKDLVKAIAELPDGTVWKDPQVVEYAGKLNWSGWTVVRVRRASVNVGLSEKRWMGFNANQMERRAREWDGRLDKSTPRPVITLHMEELRTLPVTSQHDLHRALGLPAPTGQQQQLAQRFVKPDPGYRCPLPHTCTLHPGGLV